MKNFSFRQYLAEAEGLSSTDISSEAKQRGRQILNRVAGINPSVAQKISRLFTRATKSNFVSIYNDFVMNYPKEAAMISSFKGAQTGPGEMVFYYLFDNIGVGGNLPIDLFLDGKPFAEVKAGEYSKKEAERIYDIILGGSEIAAVQQFKEDIKALNAAYKAKNGEDLPGWNGAGGDLSSTNLAKWREMEITSDGSASSHDLVLYSDGDLKTADDDELIMNVKKSKSTKALLDLIDKSSDKVKDVFSIEDAINDWAEGVAKTYLKDKLFILLDRKTLRIVHTGKLTADNIDLYRITRGDLKASIYFKKKPSKE
jgi:hypothetical protein